MSGVLGVCFDFDGTLVDSNKVKRDFFIEFFSTYCGGEEFIIDALNAPAVLDRYEIFEIFRRKFNLPKDQLREIRLDFNCQLGRRVASAPLMKGVVQCLEHLRKNRCRIFINSATPQNDLIKIVRSRSEFNDVEVVLGRPSSKSENLRTIVLASNFPADKIIVVGDGEDDRLGAVEVGCQFVPVFDYRGLPIFGIKPLQDLSLLVSMTDG
ncbi:HAD family hydrolase [Thalassospira sp. GB04J01]|uniref:HAD family hydrolase n=1 Tax=Thalassospira sp. GB04J01 TaxID=1485225 RepID=UPI000C99F658|nr:HAD family hydrolase [Thalassospira sp. GB04J01]|tara:strand:- start:61004 stop:61633 length:630 start_codon:yes stop_codon:yes gene_type:complete